MDHPCGVVQTVRRRCGGRTHRVIGASLNLRFTQGRAVAPSQYIATDLLHAILVHCLASALPPPHPESSEYSGGVYTHSTGSLQAASCISERGLDIRDRDARCINAAPPLLPHPARHSGQSAYWVPGIYRSPCAIHCSTQSPASTVAACTPGAPHLDKGMYYT